MLQHRFRPFCITSYVYLSLLLRQEKDCNTTTASKLITAISESTRSTSFLVSKWQHHHHHHQQQQQQQNILSNTTQRATYTTKRNTKNLPYYCYIQHLPQFYYHTSTKIRPLHHVSWCLSKYSFQERELFPSRPLFGRNLLFQQQRTTTTITSTTMMMTAVTSQKDVDNIHNTKVMNQCRILCISDQTDPNNKILYDNHPSTGSSSSADTAVVVVHIASNLTINSEDSLQSLVEIVKEKQINTIFISDNSAKYILSYLLPRLSSDQQQQQHPIVWIHSRSAGIDSYISSELIDWYQQYGTAATTTTTTTTTSSYPTVVQMTNAKGMFSSTLAEYSIGACTYFSKDFNRLKRNQQQRSWEKYSVSELRGSTIGIIGYGDIGRATARLAKAFGMKVLALVRQSRSTDDNTDDEYADVLIANDVTNNDGMNQIFTESDYVLCALPLTESTYHCIGKKQFDICKPNCVFINVGRGPIVDEDAMITALQAKQLKGAALDVFTIEPLPISSPLWDMDNVLMSPHNMDQTDTFLMESTTFFVEEQIPRFLRGLPLLNHVNPTLGY